VFNQKNKTMKRMYQCASALVLAALLSGPDGFAQNRNLNFSDMRDGVVMTDGQAMQIRNGQATPVEDQVTLRDGTTVRADGTVTMADGTQKQLRNGKAVNERGHIVSAQHDMMSYEAILRREHRLLGEEASPLAKAIGQGNTYALESVGRYGGFAGDAPYMTNEQIEQVRQLEQQSMAFERNVQAMDEKMALIDQLIDLSNQRLDLMEDKMAAHRRISLPEEIAQLDQEINQIEARLNDLERTSADMQTQMRERTYAQQSMTRQGGYDTNGLQQNMYPADQGGMAEGQMGYQMMEMEQQSMAIQQQVEAMEQKFEMFNELLDLTNQRLEMMENNMDAHRRIDLPEGVNQLDQQIQQLDEQLKQAGGADMMPGQPAGQPHDSQHHPATDHNNEATQPKDNE
jgi:predicted  nucleic acid-binding Zn-ribbon protein